MPVYDTLEVKHDIYIQRQANKADLSQKNMLPYLRVACDSEAEPIYWHLSTSKSRG